MHTLTVNVIWATGLRREIAKAAIGHVLVFLRRHAPDAHVIEFINQMPQAHDLVEAGDIEQRSLISNLRQLGLTQDQIRALMKEIVARAKILLGEEDAAKIQLAFSGATSSQEMAT